MMTKIEKVLLESMKDYNVDHYKQKDFNFFHPVEILKKNRKKKIIDGYYSWLEIVDSIKVNGNDILQSTNYYIAWNKDKNITLFKKCYVRFIREDCKNYILSRRIKTNMMYWNWDWDNDQLYFTKNIHSDKYSGYGQKLVFKCLPGWLKYFKLNTKTITTIRYGINSIIESYHNNKLLFETLHHLGKDSFISNYMKWNHQLTNIKTIKAYIKAVVNNYLIVINKPSLYLDYLERLNFIGYTNILQQEMYMPNDFDKAEKITLRIENKINHDKLIAEWEVKYQPRVKAISQNDYGNNNFIVKVLPTVKAFEEEGEIMHHCVFANRYFTKQDSLILSVRDSHGERLETCEIDLEKKEIAQLYGKYNKFTDYHDDIKKLITFNLNKICRDYQRQFA